MLEGNGSIALTVGGVNRSESNSSISESLLSLLEVSVEANASEGFEFRRWVGLPNSSQLYSDTESSLLSTNATISFFPSTDLNISAEFALIEYDDSQVVISESSHGSVILETEANGNFLHFGQYNLSATPSTGYVFVNWQGDGNDTQLLNGPSEQSNQLIVEGPITLQPVFAIREYEVLVTKSGNGTISGEGNYTFDDNGSNLISANPDAGWYFDKWADDGNISSLSSPTSATPQLTLPLSGPTKQSLSFTAEFVQSTHQLDLNVSEGNGSIALTVDGVNRSESNSSISESLLSLLEVSVEANASEGFEFRRWVGLPNSSQLYSDTESSLLSTNATISFFQALISIFPPSLH